MYAVLHFESTLICKPQRTSRLMDAFHFCHVKCIMTQKHVLDARYNMELASLIITCCKEHNVQQPQQIVQLAKSFGLRYK